MASREVLKLLVLMVKCEEGINNFSLVVVRDDYFNVSCNVLCTSIKLFVFNLAYRFYFIFLILCLFINLYNVCLNMIMCFELFKGKRSFH